MKIKIRIINFLFRLYLTLKEPFNIIKQDYRDFVYEVKKEWTEFKKQFYTWDEGLQNMRNYWIQFKIKSILWKIYKKIDKDEPSWVSLFKRIELKIPIKNINKKRMKWRFLKGFLPDYMRVDTDNFVFLFTDQIPKGSNTILEVRKIKALMLDNGFKKVDRIVNTERNSFKCEYIHDLYGIVYIFIYMDEVCDIEYIDVVKQEPIVTGMCAKVLEELNSN